MKFTNKRGKLRLYDGTTTTPFYLELDFDLGDFSGQLGVPKAEEILVLNRGNADADSHYIEGSDAIILEAFDINFSAFVVDKTQCWFLLDWMEAMQDGGGSPTVNSKALVTTQCSTLRNGIANSPPFSDVTKMTCNVEYQLLTAKVGGDSVVWHYNEVWFPLHEQTISEAEDGVTISLNGKVHGTVERDDAFTTGTSVET